MAEAPEHPQLRDRGAFVRSGGVVQPAPVPRFGSNLPAVPAAPVPPGTGGSDVLAAWGVDPAAAAR